MRRTGDHHAAEDLAAETFERAFRAIGRFEWRGAPLGSWLVRIADRVCVDHFRRTARRQETALGPGATASRVAESAEHQSLSNEQDANLYGALNSLSPGRRQVVLLHLGEGMSLAAIARRLGREEGAIRMLYARALKDLREELGDD